MGGGGLAFPGEGPQALALVVVGGLEVEPPGAQGEDIGPEPGPMEDGIGQVL